MSTPMVNITLNTFDAEGNQVDTSNMDLSQNTVSDIVDHAAQLVVVMRGMAAKQCGIEAFDQVYGEMEEALTSAGVVSNIQDPMPTLTLNTEKIEVMANNRLIDPADVIYLTSQACEDTGNVDKLKLDSLGLESGSFMDSSYPLTDAEACFIGEDVADMAGHLALTGYSVLIGNRKYLAPTIELNYHVWDSEEDPEEQSEKWAMDANERLRPICQKIAEMTGGHFVWNPEAAVEFSNGDGRFTVEIYIPFDYAQEHANGFEQWKDHLKALAIKAKAA